MNEKFGNFQEKYKMSESNNLKTTKVTTVNERPRDKTKELVVMALFVALDIIFQRFIAPIKLPTMQLTFGFVTVILTGMYLGPVRAGIIAVVSDLLTGLLGLTAGTFFPGFTLSALTNGVLSGYFLEGKKSAKIGNVVIWAILSSLIVSTLMNTLWLVIMYSDGDMSKFIPRLLPRIWTQAAITVAKIVFVPIIYNGVFRKLRLEGVERNGIR